MVKNEASYKKTGTLLFGLGLVAGGLSGLVVGRRLAASRRMPFLDVWRRALAEKRGMVEAATGESCPVNHKNWPKGCVTTLATSVGARIRYQLDRDSEVYKNVYKQRTATERINSQAKELGIERPRLRNGQAIANQNTLIYVLINLRALHRVRRKKAARDSTV